MVVTIPYTSKELKYEVDSPDSNFIRAVTYLIGKVWPYAFVWMFRMIGITISM